VTWYQPRSYGISPHYSGFWRRFVASWIDTLVFGLVGYPLSYLLSGILLRLVFEAGTVPSSLGIVLLIWFVTDMTVICVLAWLYYAGLESSPWQATLGKLALGIVVTNLARGRVSFGRATGRHFASYISVFFFIGYLIQPFTAKHQALHDLIAGTLVVRS
jgi:uncharacterized RDD family membrane protein YckC